MRRFALCCAFALSMPTADAAAGRRAPRLGTLAYVVSECRIDTENQFTGRQRLLIQHGADAPVTVLTFESAAPVFDVFRACFLYGDNRFGSLSLLVGGFHRLAVRPGGDAVVFEVNAELAFIKDLAPPSTIAPGFYYVRADGTGVRWLGPPSRVRDYAVFGDSTPSNSLGLAVNVFTDLYWSPDGRTIAYTDKGPGPDGGEADQVVALDVASGMRHPVTTLPQAAHVPPAEIGSTRAGAFVDDDTIAFSTYAFGDATPALFTIDVDGTHQVRVPDPIAVPDAKVIPSFAVTGARGRVATFELPRSAMNSDEGSMNVHEAFIVDGKRSVQISNFQRVDTLAQALSSSRVFFTGSGDTLGTNSEHGCQLFSATHFGGGLRQLTAFRGTTGGDHCTFGTPECYIGPVIRDPSHHALLFMSSCGPVADNSYGAQVFLMHESGGPLQQLTALRGATFEPDGARRVELPGPIAYAAGRRER